MEILIQPKTVTLLGCDRPISDLLDYFFGALEQRLSCLGREKRAAAFHFEAQLCLIIKIRRAGNMAPHVCALLEMNMSNVCMFNCSIYIRYKWTHILRTVRLACAFCGRSGWETGGENTCWRPSSPSKLVPRTPRRCFKLITEETWFLPLVPLFSCVAS